MGCIGHDRVVTLNPKCSGGELAANEAFAGADEKGPIKKQKTKCSNPRNHGASARHPHPEPTTRHDRRTVEPPNPQTIPHPKNPKPRAQVGGFRA